MIRSVFQQASPFVKLIFMLFVMVISFLLVFLLGVLVAIPFTHVSFTDIAVLANDLSNPDNILYLKYIQGLNTTGLFIVPPFIIASLSGQKAVKYLNLRMQNPAITFLIVTVIMLAALPLINFLAELNSKISLPGFMAEMEQMMKNAEENARIVTEKFVNVSTFSGYLFNLLIIAILPALGEEFIFRGVFQKLFVQWTKNVHVGIVLAAVFFSAFHFQFYGFVPRMLMGLFFGYLLVWTGSIWIPVVGHFINNATAVTFYYLYNIGFIKTDIENIGAESNEINTVIISTMMVIALVFAVYFVERKKKDLLF